MFFLLSPWNHLKDVVAGKKGFTRGAEAGEKTKDILTIGHAVS